MSNAPDPSKLPPPHPISRPSLGGWRKKLGWFILLWTVSVLALGAVAYLFRILMRAAGLSTT